MTNKYYEREKVEIKFHLELLKELLERNMKYHTHGWTMKKKVKWQRLHAKREQQVKIHLIEEMRKLEQMMSVQMRCEELRQAELKMEVSICGLEHGEILSEEINEKDLMNYRNSSEELEDMLTREADEAMKPLF